MKKVNPKVAESMSDNPDLNPRILTLEPGSSPLN